MDYLEHLDGMVTNAYIHTYMYVQITNVLCDYESLYYSR